MDDWKAKMPRTAPKEGYQHVVVSRKRADGLRMEWTGELSDKVAEYLTQHTILLAQDRAVTGADYEETLADHRRLVRELDRLLNGDAAAPQASLGDIVAQVRRESVKPVPHFLKELYSWMSRAHFQYAGDERRAAAFAAQIEDLFPKDPA